MAISLPFEFFGQEMAFIYIWRQFLLINVSTTILTYKKHSCVFFLSFKMLFENNEAVPEHALRSVVCIKTGWLILHRHNVVSIAH